jgi:hypothetical protein
MKSRLLLVSLALISSLAHAGEQVGAIVYVRVRASDGLIHFSLTGTKINSPSCAIGSYWMIRDENSNTGKQQYAMLLAAQLAGKSISVSGSNTCTRWIDGEDANEIFVVN